MARFGGMKKTYIKPHALTIADRARKSQFFRRYNDPNKPAVDVSDRPEPAWKKDERIK